jgi:hypothetical protein
VITSFTLVRKRPELTDEQFFERWTEHTQRFDLKDHPYITKNRLMMIQGHPEFCGMAENEWPDMDSLTRTADFYQNDPDGQAHWTDLLTFMDIDNSPTVIVTAEADITAARTLITRMG